MSQAGVAWVDGRRVPGRPPAAHQPPEDQPAMPLTERRLDCDVLVAGGGIAGTCCGLAAARLGARVVLLQDRPVLGGNASSEVRMHVVGATGLSGGQPLVDELREGGIVEEIRLDQCVRNPQRAPALLDLALYDACRREPSLTLLLDTTLVAAVVEGSRIVEVRAERQSTEDAFRIRAPMFVDGTGDGRLGLEAGARFAHGRESRQEHGESLAPEEADRQTLGSTILFQARRHDAPMPFTPPPWVRRFEAGDFTLRPYAQPGFDLGLEYGYWWIEWGGCLDTVRDNARIRDELLAITLGVWDFVKNRSGVDASHWALEWIGFVPGKRESRRFVGRHVLTEQDVRSSQPFADAIAYGGWPIDMHPPEGIDAPELPPCTQHLLPFVYDIPLRACVAADLENLMFAGRIISATHVAFASTRVMATCGAVGQGVGTAAALAVRAGVPPAAIAARPDLMRSIQQQLLRDDCFLIGAVNEDPDDLVRAAVEVRASSAQPEGAAELVRSGRTRTLGRVPPDRAAPGLHRWMSDPAAGLPAALEVRWGEDVLLAELALVFDTGLHRLLTLSQADGYTRKMLWGRPQPETVRDYTIAGETAGGWRELVVVRDNHQRRRVHRLADGDRFRAVRITVLATHGLDHARIVELRAYAR